MSNDNSNTSTEWSGRLDTYLLEAVSQCDGGPIDVAKENREHLSTMSVRFWESVAERVTEIMGFSDHTPAWPSQLRKRYWQIRDAQLEHVAGPTLDEIEAAILPAIDTRHQRVEARLDSLERFLATEFQEVEARMEQITEILAGLVQSLEANQQALLILAAGDVRGGDDKRNM